MSVSSLSIEVGTSELTASFTVGDFVVSDNRRWSLFVGLLMQLRLVVNNVFVRCDAWRGTEGTRFKHVFECRKPNVKCSILN